MKLCRSLLTAVASCGLVLAALPVATAAPALAQPTVRCPVDGCGGGGGGGGGNPPAPPSQTIGQDLTAITAFTNTGLSCTFGFPVVTTTFATRVSTWTASVQCSAPVPHIFGKAVFDTWYFPGQSIACHINICGGFVPDFGATASITMPGSATLSPGVSYGVQSEVSVEAPPGQFWLGGPITTNGSFAYCNPDEAGHTGFLCWLDSGPFSVP